MENLDQQKCVPCRGDSPAVTRAEMSKLHLLIPDWRITEQDQSPRLERVFKFKNFAQALAFTDKVGAAAEAEGHHPVILTEWGKVTVTWWTHKIKNLHFNDFIMAAKTDRLYADSGA